MFPVFKSSDGKLSGGADRVRGLNKHIDAFTACEQTTVCTYRNVAFTDGAMHGVKSVHNAIRTSHLLNAGNGSVEPDIRKSNALYAWSELALVKQSLTHGTDANNGHPYIVLELFESF
jgi:hypothetical protein